MLVDMPTVTGMNFEACAIHDQGDRTVCPRGLRCALRVRALRDSVETSGTANFRASRAMIDRPNPCICRRAKQKTDRGVRQISIARSEYRLWPPRVYSCGADQSSTEPMSHHTARAPRRRKLSLYSGQFVTRYLARSNLARCGSLNLYGVTTYPSTSMLHGYRPSLIHATRSFEMTT